ncbi:DUF1697 domain-containing protein [Nocardioides acrostichi]|uniref:DUF1697 domain-containing protein n=1 Tax=Nocardioides acrostichi TaxID=2784339 RepID=A0A930YEX2_9ACTN|nr:DUF1697 domain-containing protein [Nocardioides acrostichi]MBF4163884.1 DUF1697 domain-containing protein [Nocardioides acrostichi]
MTRYAALVRNVMLGRQGIDRDGLLRTAADAGARDVRSHLATGNLTVTFDGPPDDLAALLERGVEAMLGRPEPVMVRTREQLAELLATDPYAGLDPQEWEMEVSFLRHDAPCLDPARVPESHRTRVLLVRERELVTARPPEGTGRPHVNRLLERATRLPASARGWRTLHRLASALDC